MTEKKKGRPPGRPLNHNLFLENGVWIIRYTRNGEDRRRSTKLLKPEVAAARKIRDAWFAERAMRRHGVEDVPLPVTVGEMVKLYLEAESKPYDRETGGEQPGAKRDSASDRVIVERLKKHLDFGLAADLVDKERLLDVATALSDAGLAGLTIRNSFRLIRRVFGWAKSNPRKTGVRSNPFDGLEKGERKKLFPSKVAAKAPPFMRDQLLALYEILPAHVRRPVRFGAHTGLRWRSELLRMTWGRVDLDRRIVRPDPRYAKRGKERDVPLGDVSIEILRSIRPGDAKPGDPVWLNTRGERLRDVRDLYEAAVEKVCPTPEAGWRYPDFHSLRRTCATALSNVAPKHVVRAILGHSDEDVTDRYVTATLDDLLAAVDRAALLIDGEATDNVAPWKIAAPKKATA